MSTPQTTVTIADVARKSGFSKSAVSFVLNDAPLAKRISEETKALIRQAAEDLGYRPNHLARHLRSKRNQTIGIVVFDISDPYCTQILRGIEEVLYRFGSHLPLLTDVQNDRVRFKRYVTMLLERQVEGLIVLGNSIYPETELLEVLRECRTPIVMIGRELENGSLNSVTADNGLGARAALEHLYDLGHRQVAFIRGPKVMIDSNQRWKAIEGFARTVRMPLDAALILDTPLTIAGQQAGYELTQRLLRGKKRFTALQAYDDLTAFGAIRALNEAGIEVPRQCSVIGFDDVAMSAYYNPPLTTIHQDMELQGRIGAEILLDALREPGDRNPGARVRKLVTPRLVVRASTAPLNDVTAIP
ncbi:MAG: LacI family DNA-binding transcriptional regulator [Blastocatellia bacterium]